jgi:pimeloyl-ACP methyl ester carboxylesterase
MAAALTHNVSPARLAYIAANIPKIAIVTGDDDHLVRPSGSERIKKGMDSELGESDRGRVELLKWEGTGHGIHAQREEEFNRLVERCVREGKKAVEEGFKGRDL